ncbi:hypothetical protein AX15_005117 [Amanita polypyramis BW_CC]|nr:hypothetical protein AX15_005117 [Amanita polypyramis BW_CC]
MVLAAIECWGRGVDVLRSKAMPPRPPLPLAPAGEHSRTAVGKRSKQTQAPQQTRSRKPGGGEGTKEAGNEVKLEDWDEDDVMLILCLSKSAAEERHLEGVHEKNRRLVEWWRQDVARALG